MPIMNYTTTIAVEKTMGEINAALEAARAEIVRLGAALERARRAMSDLTDTLETHGPTPPCATCGEPVYLTVSGPWRHVERDYAHAATPDREVSHDGHRITERPTLTSADIPRFCHTCDTDIKETNQ